ncbi:MAG: caspase domain-containing protein [Leptolyngbyaceae cyanobacterium]
MAKRIPFICSAISGDELKAGNRDVTLVYGLLTDPALGACTSKGFEPFMNCKTRHDLEGKLFPILTKCKREDQLIFYFSGHGEIINNQFCFKFGKSDLYPFNNLLNDFDIRGVSRRIIIIDACHSGAAIKGNLINLSNINLPKGSAIIASSRAIQTSRELKDGSASVFTDLFCEGIKTGLGGEPSKKNLISVSDIVSYIKDRLDNDPEFSGFRQRPVHKINKADEIIWISHNKSLSKQAHKVQVETKESSEKRSFLDDLPHLNYDRRTISGYTLGDLDTDLIKIFLQQPFADEVLIESGSRGKTPVEHLELLGLFTDEKPTLGAFLCFSLKSLVIDKFASCSLQMVVYSGTKRSSSKASPKLSQDNLLNLFDIGMNFFRRDAGLRRTGDIGTSRRDDLEVPEIALREALANALVHRNYENPNLKDQPLSGAEKSCNPFE